MSHGVGTSQNNQTYFLGGRGDAGLRFLSKAGFPPASLGRTQFVDILVAEGKKGIYVACLFGMYRTCEKPHLLITSSAAPHDGKRPEQRDNI